MVNKTMSNTRTFKYEEIFQDIPDNPDEVLMTIPPDICEEMGWEPGDELKISIGDQGSIIIELKDNGKK